MRFDPSTSVIVLPVELTGPAGTQTLDLVLDTGASLVLVHRKDARLLGYDVDAAERSRSITTVSGIERLPVLTAERVRALGVAVDDVDLVCHDLPPGSGVDGLLGLSFLRHLDLDLHLRSGRIEAVAP